MYGVLNKRSNGCEVVLCSGNERCPISSSPAEDESVLAYTTAHLTNLHSPLHTATSLYKAQVKITTAF